MNFSDPFCLYSPMSIAQAIAKVNTNKEPMLPIFMAASIHYLKCSTSDRKSQYEAAAWNYDLNIKNSKKMPLTRCVIYLLGSPAKRESS